MSALLHSYLSQLAEQGHVECETLTIAVDNAHCPLQIVDNTCDSISRSRSAIVSSNSSADLRWMAMESSSSSDFSLSVPSRSLDDMEYTNSQRGTPPKRIIFHHVSIDSTERWLRELPCESSTPKTTGSPHEPRRLKSFDDDDSDFSDDDEEDLPLLKQCPYGEKEKHPTGMAKLRLLNRGGEMNFLLQSSTYHSVDDSDFDSRQSQKISTKSIAPELSFTKLVTGIITQQHSGKYSPKQSTNLKAVLENESLHEILGNF